MMNGSTVSCHVEGDVVQRIAWPDTQPDAQDLETVGPDTETDAEDLEKRRREE